MTLGMLNMRRSVLCLLALTSVVLAAVPSDEVKSLPGWDGELPTRQYSGYIEIDSKTKSFLHYWFVESESNPTTDPVVIWMNGGPGCSSMEGYFMEQGPLHFDPSTVNETLPKLEKNPYAWNKIANMLFLEAPLGVGFSYSDTKSEYSTNDTKTASDNYIFVQKWLQAFPEYSKNDLYISGESYAGIYVPTLAEAIMIGNEKNISNILLKGFMVGNGCIGNEVGTCSLYGVEILANVLFGHALYSTDLHNELLKHCDFPNISQECEEVFGNVLKVVGPINVYDIYDDCSGDFARGSNWRVRNPYLMKLGLSSCANDGATMTKYLNRDDVRSAIHVKSSSEIGPWEMCSSKIKYNPNTKSLLPIYPTLIKTYRVLVYNGDVDACVPYLGDEIWTSGLNFTVSSPWKAWYVDDQVAGYVTQYDVNSFKFITVKGSGHMVPQYRPKQALAMFENYINNKPY